MESSLSCDKGPDMMGKGETADVDDALIRRGASRATLDG